MVQSGMISLMIRFDAVDELMKTYNILIDDGKALMEPSPQFYAKVFKSTINNLS